jgi:PhnB protein
MNPKAPDGRDHHTVTPVLAVRGGEQALAFYARAFSACEILRVPGPSGTVAHAQMRIGDSLFFLADEMPENRDSYLAPATLGGTSCAMYIYFDDADAMFEQAVAAGAQPLAAVEQRPWGDREGLVRDPFGHLWALATRNSTSGHQ